MWLFRLHEKKTNNRKVFLLIVCATLLAVLWPWRQKLFHDFFNQSSLQIACKSEPFKMELMRNMCPELAGWILNAKLLTGLWGGHTRNARCNITLSVVSVNIITIWGNNGITDSVNFECLQSVQDALCWVRIKSFPLFYFCSIITNSSSIIIKITSNCSPEQVLSFGTKNRYFTQF